MKYINRLLKNASQTSQLKPKWKQFNSFVGLVGCFSGLAVWVGLLLWILSFQFEITQQPLNQWQYGSGFLAIPLGILSMIVITMPLMQIFAFLCSVFLVVIGKMTMSQAKGYAITNEYPKEWLNVI
jgi:hypothetical protein